MENFNTYLKSVGEFGIVTNVNGCLVTIEGLPGAKMHELVFFEGGGVGQVLALDRNLVRVVTISGELPQAKERVTRTNRGIAIALDDSLVGTTVDPLLTGRTGKMHTLTGVVEGIGSRVKIQKPLHTGLALVDLLIPLGAGQKELIIGDRKTGKTNFLLTAVKNQTKEDKIVILALIGKRKSEIQKINHFLKKEDLQKKIILIVSEADDPDYLVYLTPFTAMTIAEYYKEKGVDSVVILDDLTTHAKVYRQMALLSGKFPGRESYPGDLFYIHARLLERAGNFISSVGQKDTSITCIPVAETVGGDFSGHIITNLMGITDGHIFFDSALFEKGKRPAINIFLSVTRVGRQTQTPLGKDISQKVTAFLAEYEAMQNLAHFGAELSQEVQMKLKKGERLLAIFEQNYNTVIERTIQLLMIGIIWGDLLGESSIQVFQQKLLAQRDLKNMKFLEKVKFTGTLEEFVEGLKEQRGEIAKLLC